ncbi:MAG TPA: Tex-like N-terminal domain-containing protein, partial [Clostridiales bacterium]|nr:Tex-like N-terminal domain-containing protein [Clostridiales bacterium]
MELIETLAAEFHLQRWQAENTVKLIEEGNTIPFIARYRKEAHGSLDDQVLRELHTRLEYLKNLDKRREEIQKSITEQEKMTPELLSAIQAAETLATLEDLYRPYKQKRRTRATVAKEKGLEPLADTIWSRRVNGSLHRCAEAYLSEEKGVLTAEDALQGASDILAERISEDAEYRGRLRNLFLQWATLDAKAAKEEDSVYAQYYDYSEPVKKIAGHRVLAVDRGEKEGFLKVSVVFDREKAMTCMDRTLLHGKGTETDLFLAHVGEDAYDRLIYPSVEREIRAALTEEACTGAIKVFAKNLRPLLMAPPVKNKVVMALDPGYRMGCKVAVTDATGAVLDTAVIYVTQGKYQYQKAKEVLKRLIQKYKVDVLSIGNGTASKETELFAAELLSEVKKETGRSLSYMVVSEAGASVYSASKLAAEEFPQFDVNLRSAVSIARRLQDPLAELVKIDPKAIGVGQYQHDMPQKQLTEALDGVVEDCVNEVGADLNTASPSLL